VMLGYWNNTEATKAMFTAEGWLNTGDTARFDADGRIYITGRLKEIIVMSNGEKVPPVDMEAAILQDTLFEQVMVLGEGKPYLTVFVVLNRDQWAKVAPAHGLDPNSESAMRSQQAEKVTLERIQRQIKTFPGYAQVYRAAILMQPWTIENGMLTPTMKLKREKVVQAHQKEYEKLYEGH
jgi:long-chain acyl-CoA synthetase